MNLSNKFSILILVLISCSCEKLVEVDSPIGQVVGQEVYNSNSSAAAVLTGIYVDMTSPGIFTGISSIGLKTGLSSDELVSVASSDDILSKLYSNSLTNNGDQLFWTPLYSYVFRINSAIEGLQNSTSISGAVRDELLGEAMFLRAFMYFNLTNLYGDVPLVLTTDPKINSQIGRASKASIYDQMIADLNASINGLSDVYLSSDLRPTTNRFRPNKWTAMALLARVYLYHNEWGKAEQLSTTIINNNVVYSLEDVQNVFKNASKEALWQLQSVSSQYVNTQEGPVYILAGDLASGLPEGPSGTSGRPVYLQPDLAHGFSEDDNRKRYWIDSVVTGGNTFFYPTKYRSWLINDFPFESLTVFRLAEQYLIRAEARIQLNRLTGDNSAIQDLNTIRQRAGLDLIDVTDSESLTAALLVERQHEFFTEFGHRWFDLKRTNTVNAVMEIITPKKGGTWEPYKALYPIPVIEFVNSPILRGHQNPGYPEF